MSRVERDPERGRAVAAKLKELGVKGILLRAAEQGYITELACKMPRCFCPEELGGASYFEPVSGKLSDWMPTHEHFPRPKRDGGRQAREGRTSPPQSPGLPDDYLVVTRERQRAKRGRQPADRRR